MRGETSPAYARVRFDAAEEGKDALATTHDISHKLIDELFREVDEGTPKLLKEYDLEDEVDTRTVSDWLKIAFAEDISRMCDAGVWDGEDDVERIIADMQSDDAVSNCATVAGRVANRNEDMMRLSEAIIKDSFSSE